MQHVRLCTGPRVSVLAENVQLALAVHLRFTQHGQGYTWADDVAIAVRRERAMDGKFQSASPITSRTPTTITARDDREGRRQGNPKRRRREGGKQGEKTELEGMKESADCRGKKGLRTCHHNIVGRKRISTGGRGSLPESFLFFYQSQQTLTVALGCQRVCVHCGFTVKYTLAGRP